jgi:hypothetical protein
MLSISTSEEKHTRSNLWILWSANLRMMRRCLRVPRAAAIGWCCSSRILLIWAGAFGSTASVVVALSAVWCGHGKAYPESVRAR